ncbi:hypothetical protein [Cysteiniphilum sp. QT6929]|uniref:hypothetical protein n=1 Tax=Cysteiniphilum sp. QT6929 TaxID=2975055 RepID=UPI0024B3526A|nr:hypothetical protein [Cysteiniphilum sp. QT6929]WHN65161.1 hypothetical protein NYP54_08935 [Cysteiniphilum sp. QT6929]
MKKKLFISVILGCACMSYAYSEDYCSAILNQARIWNDSGSIIKATKTIVFPITCNYSGNDLNVRSTPISGTNDEAVIDIQLKKHGLVCPDADGQFKVTCRNNVITYIPSSLVFSIFNAPVGNLLLNLSKNNDMYEASGTGSAEGASLNIDLFSNTQYLNAKLMQALRSE